ncbi:hypothetical protein [Streptomyces sparsus]
MPFPPPDASDLRRVADAALAGITPALAARDLEWLTPPAPPREPFRITGPDALTADDWHRVLIGLRHRVNR